MKKYENIKLKSREVIRLGIYYVSILSGLVGLKKGLFLTNVFVETKNNYEKKNNLFTLIF